MRNHHHDVGNQAEDYRDREPLEEELPRPGEVQEVGFCGLFLMGVLLWEGFPAGSETWCQRRSRACEVPEAREDEVEERSRGERPVGEIKVCTGLAKE